MDNGDLYKFKLVSDTLKLYKVDTHWDKLEHKIGPLSLELIKVKE